MVANEDFNLNLQNEEEEFVVDFGETTNLGGGGGTTNFNQLTNRPKYDNVTMTGGTNIPKVPTKTSELTNDINFATETEVGAAVEIETLARENADTTLNTAITSETTARQNADNGLQSQIDAIVASSDVKDIVGTYADLQAYDTSTLGNNDIIKVLQDETHSNETTYYRWSTSTSSFSLIGEEGPYYTKAQTDTLLNGKQNTLTAGNNIQISGDTISATDTTYSDFIGTDGTAAGQDGLVPAPATTDAGKFLKADGTWDTAGGSIAPVQTTGTSTTDVMSQNATTTMVYPDITNHPDTIKLGSKNVNYTEGSDSVAIGGSAAGSAQYTIAIGANAVATGNAGAIGIGQGTQSTKSKAVGVGYGALAKGNDAISVGTSANTTQAEAIAIGHSSRATSTKSLSVGYQAATSAYGAIALGANSSASTQGEMNIGTSDTTNGYSNSNYRLISGVYDGQSAHDAATKGQLDSIAIKNAGAPTTATVGTVGQLLEDTTNGKLYICTDATNPYVWEEVSGGGGGGDTVYSTKTTSNSATGGAVYIGNLGTDQTEVQDPSPNDNHYKYFWALPWSNNGTTYGQPGNGSVNILGSAKGNFTVAIGSAAGSGAYGAAYAVMIGNNANAGSAGISIGDGAGTTQDFTGNVCIGAAAIINTYGTKNSISLGRFSMATRTGELNIGTGANPTEGFNSTNYRVIGGVHDGQEAHDAVTVGQVNAVIDAINTALSTNIPHIGASS